MNQNHAPEVRVPRAGIRLIVFFLILAAAAPLAAEPVPETIYFAPDTGFVDSTGKAVPGAGFFEAATRVAYVTADMTSNLVATGEDYILDGGFHTLAGDDQAVRGRNKRSGISVAAARDVIVANFHIDTFNNGIEIVGSRNVTVIAVHTSGCRTGVKLDAAENAVVEDCRITENFNGVMILGGRDNTLRRNRVEDNRRLGIKVTTGSRSNLLEYNSVLGNYLSGIVLSNDTTQNTLRYNSIGLNERVGLVIHGVGTRTLVYNNNFFRNRTQHVWVYYRGARDRFFLPPPVGGNFWDSRDPGSAEIEASWPWTFPDNDRDGFTDYPYPIYQLNQTNVINQDRYPWTKPDGWESLPEPGSGDRP